MKQLRQRAVRDLLGQRPIRTQQELAAALLEAGKDVELHVIDAPYGHDCFLLEEARQTPMIQKFLGSS